MSQINFLRTYLLHDIFSDVKERASQHLNRYMKYPSLITFDDSSRSVTFSTERLIPSISTNRPRVMLLFSNPHPNSILQGMFLSPNTGGRQNLFWSSMEDAGWILIPDENRSPELLADICLNVKYQGPFELIFYCFWAFPTNYPEDISRIFGKAYFKQVIEPDAMDEFLETIRETSVDAVVTFNKGVFNRVSRDKVERFIKCLMAGELVQSQVDGIDRNIPIYLTFPTGWRYHKNHRHLRNTNLNATRDAISQMVER